MPRQRPVLPVAELKELANEHTNRLNAIIRKSNEGKQEQAKERVVLFLHEALGGLDVGDLIADYEKLQAQMKDLDSRFKRFMGNNQSIVSYTTDQRKNLADRVIRRDTNLPAGLITEVERVAKRRGTDMGEVLPVSELEQNQLLDRLRLCRSIQEIENVIRQFTITVITRVGVDAIPDEVV